MRRSFAGIVTGILLVGIVAATLILAGAFYLKQNKKPPPVVQTTVQSTPSANISEAIDQQQLPSPTPCPSTSLQIDNKESWTQYKDSFFSVNYPNAWYQFCWGDLAKFGYYEVEFSTRTEAETDFINLTKDDFVFSVNVSTIPTDQETEGSNEWEVMQAFPSDKRYIGAENVVGKSITKIVSLPVLNGIEGFEVERIPPPYWQADDFYIREIYFLRDNKIIRITPVSTYVGKERYQMKEKLFDQILSTFKFTN